MQPFRDISLERVSEMLDARSDGECEQDQHEQRDQHDEKEGVLGVSGASRNEEEREGSGDEFEDCEDDKWLQPYDDAQAAAPAGAVEPALPAGSRKRKRDGKVVKRSASWYSVYKLSRRNIKKAGTYYVGSAEDRPTLEVRKNLLDWVQVRQYQCRYFARLLRDYGRITEEVAGACMFEIEAVLDWILQHPQLAADMDMGNAWLWVAVMVQQLTSLVLKKPFVFTSNEVINRWSLDSLNEDMRRPPHPTGLFASADQRMSVEAELYTERPQMNHALAAGHFERMLCGAAPSSEHNPIRAAAKKRAWVAGIVEPPWLYPRIAEAKKAQRAERGLFGEIVFVDVD